MSLLASKLYQVLLLVLYPAVRVRLWWRGRREPEYRLRVSERMGLVPAALAAQSKGAIWFHTVSAGETISAAPLVQQMHQAFPESPILVTTMTPTGSAQVVARLPDVGHCYAPYDFPWAVKRFLDAVQPAVLVLMETELWPNLIAGAVHRDIPVVLVNARLSERSAEGYAKVRALAHPMFQQLAQVACQERAHAQRFIELGVDASRVVVTGNLKFDKRLPADVSIQSAARSEHWQIGDRWVWIAASTHPGEDEVALAAHEQLLTQDPSALLLLVPRHPVRGPTVAELTRNFGLTCALQSVDEVTPVQVIVADTMGELQLLYALAQAAFVGGSIAPVGGHDPVEAALCGIPMAMGPNRYNFTEVCDRFAAEDALSLVSDAQSLGEWLQLLQGDRSVAQAQGARGVAVVAANLGAQQQLFELLRSRLLAL